MATRLILAEGLRLPTTMATETLLIVGKRGSGKSTTAARFAEQLFRSNVQFACLDPVDSWWGLKAGADGSREGGLEVHVFGGEHADLPLEPTAGKLMADVLVDDRINAVMVIRAFSNRDKARFVTDFADRLFHRNRDVLHLFCEEAHEVMPQNPYKGEEEMLGRMLKLQKLGRSSGIGLSSITQRPASLNKNATTQAEILIAHRILGPQDVKAVDEWIKHHHQQEKRAEMLGSLGELKTGEAWVWAPDFPEAAPIGLKRVAFFMPETFDSRRTPKPGEKKQEPKSLAPIDIEKLKDRMAATIERAKAEDPRELRKKIAELEKQLKAKPQQVSAAPKVETQRVEVPVVREKTVEKVRKMIERLETTAARSRETAEQATEAAKALAGSLKIPAPQMPVRHSSNGHAKAVPQIERRRLPASATEGQILDGPLSIGERRILAALIQYPDGRQRGALTTLTGYKRSTRDAYILRLAKKGFVQEAGDMIVATQSGIEALPDYEPLPSGKELQDYWLRKLSVGERSILEILLAEFPNPVDRDALTDRTGYMRSTRDAYLLRMQKKQIVEPCGAGQVKAADQLFA